jgi:hypothetical protein
MNSADSLPSKLHTCSLTDWPGAICLASLLPVKFLYASQSGAPVLPLSKAR